jgi:hypothetical protein
MAAAHVGLSGGGQNFGGISPDSWDFHSAKSRRQVVVTVRNKQDSRQKQGIFGNDAE